jgi:hypothetical protein
MVVRSVIGTGTACATVCSRGGGVWAVLLGSELVLFRRVVADVRMRARGGGGGGCLSVCQWCCCCFSAGAVGNVCCCYVF